MLALEKFNKKNHKNTIIATLSISTLLIISFMVIKSYAFYHQNDSYDILKNKIGDWRFANNISYDNSQTNLNCKDDNAHVQCAIDELNNYLMSHHRFLF